MTPEPPLTWDPQGSDETYTLNGQRQVYESLTRIGPDLTGRRYPAEPLAKFLAHPDSIQLTRTTRLGPWKMPNLGLTEREIASLVAMINTGRQVSVR